MKERNGKFKDPMLEKEVIQHHFLIKIAEFEPKVFSDLPVESFQKLRNLETWNLLAKLIGKENVSDNDLLATFPDADPNTIEKDFACFNKKMVSWADKYCLKKDW